MKKEMIKNIAIVFLAVLLVLTFFSNTIMNFSLPEVNAQYVTGGNINEKIRGSGIVEANNTYEVMVSETRTIKSVNVKNGDTVKKGQSLLVLEDSESSELSEAQELLANMELEYQKSLLNDELPDYALDDLAIQNARDDLQRAIEQRDELAYGDNSEISDIENRIDSLNSEIRTLTGRKESIQNAITALETDDYSSMYLAAYETIISPYLEYTNAETNLEAAKAELADLEANALNTSELNTSCIEKQREIELIKVEIERLKEDLQAVGGSDTEKERLISDKEYSLKYAEEDLKASQELLNQARETDKKINEAKDAVLNAENEFGQAKTKLSKSAAELGNQLNSQLSEISGNIDSLNSDLEKAQKQLADAQADSPLMTYEQADEAVSAAQRTLNELLVNLAKTQKDDKLQNALAALDIEAAAEKIELQKERVEKLKENSSEAEIKAAVNGVITQVNCSAGEKTMADTSLMTIQITEKGYTVSFSVSNEASKKVKVGSQAEITNLYDGNAEAVLQSIKPNPENTREKLLIFSVTGDVTANQTLNIAAGGKNAKYDMVVPNSAVKEDKNGKFLLVVQAKNTPLGNRYKAQRVDIEVLAADDTSSAVSGNLSGSEFVITASDTPIESGMQVRLAED